MLKDIENQEVNIATESLKKIQQKHKKETECNDCLLYSFMYSGCGAIILGIVAGNVAYTVFGIMFLVNDYPKSNNCTDIDLWVYVLVSVILSFNRFAVKSNEDYQYIIPALICKGFIELGLSIWGGVELFKSSCHNKLWNFALASFIIQLSMATICLLFIPIVFLYIKYVQK